MADLKGFNFNQLAEIAKTWIRKQYASPTRKQTEFLTVFCLKTDNVGSEIDFIIRNFLSSF
jgi:hypothetical protein